MSSSTQRNLDAEFDEFMRAEGRSADEVRHVDQKLTEFLDFQKQHNRKVALITSGGTTVPLESNTVRFIDNFSIGTRGAAACEYFLLRNAALKQSETQTFPHFGASDERPYSEDEYAIVFLHRRGSLMPFTRHCLSTTHRFDMFVLNEERGRVEVAPNYQDLLFSNVAAWQNAVDRRTILLLEFTSVIEYLQILRVCAERLAVFGRHALLLLAAAVSDFYVPRERLSEHKISSDSSKPFELTLSLVPKALAPLSATWCPNAFTVSFKLETDHALLFDKAAAALSRYSHRLVIANLLTTRRSEVWFVAKNETEAAQPTLASAAHSQSSQAQHDGELRQVSIERIALASQESDTEIERLIVDRLVHLHRLYLNSAS